MGIFDFLTAEKKEEKLMQEKTSRAIAIAVSCTSPEELVDVQRYGREADRG